MAIVSCSVDGCDTKPRCKGLCNKHYIRLRNHGDATFRFKPEGRQVCTIEECDKLVEGNGLCGMHYMRNKRTGSPHGATRKTYSCRIDGCSNKHYGQNLCQPHYHKWYRYGDPEVRLPGEVRAGKKVCSSCSNDLPLDSFGTDARQKSGKSIYCTTCAVAKAKEWAIRNPEKSKQSQQAWARRNPEKVLAVAHRRNALKRKVFVEDVDRTILAERDGWLCGICAGPISQDLKWPHPKSLSIDHVIPLSRGGIHGYANTQASHLDCNVRKGARMIA